MMKVICDMIRRLWRKAEPAEPEGYYAHLEWAGARRSG